MKIIILAVISVMIIGMAHLAYAEVGDTRPTLTGIFNDGVVQISITVTVIGIGTKAVLAVVTKGAKEFNPRLTLISLITGMLASLPIVATTIENVSADTEPVAFLIIIITTIAAVAGIDGGAKKVGQKLMSPPKDQPKPNSEVPQ